MSTVLLLIENTITARNAQQVLECGGLNTVQVANCSQLNGDNLSQHALLLCPWGSVRDILQRCPNAAGPRLVFYSESPDPEFFKIAGEHDAVMGFAGLRYPGAPPRSWELLALARRIVSNTPPPPDFALAWGHEWHVRTPSTPLERDATVAEVEAFATRLLPTHRAHSIAELAHELLMNAMFDAPVDDKGAPLYAFSRKEAIELSPAQRPNFGFGCDGTRLLVSIQDPFGRLTKRALFSGIYRGLSSGTMDQNGGGAGLGMLLIHQAATVIFVDIIPQRLTQVSAVLELDVPTRELRKLPRSVHCFNYMG